MNSWEREKDAEQKLKQTEAEIRLKQAEASRLAELKQVSPETALVVGFFGIDRQRLLVYLFVTLWIPLVTGCAWVLMTWKANVFPR